MNKERIAHRFSSAISTYEDEAVEQRHIAEQLASMIKFWGEAKSLNFKRIAEVGCGTGLLSKILVKLFSPETLWLNDLCCSVKDIFNSYENTFFCGGDIEKILQESEQFYANKGGNNLIDKTTIFPLENDLIASSSVIQWLDSPIEFLLNCKKYLSEKGIVAVSTFGEKNFLEIREITGRGLRYIPLEELKNKIANQYTILASAQSSIKQIFSTPMEVLLHLKRTGVTGVSDVSEGGEFKWSKSRLEKFCIEYQERFSQTEAKESKGVTLTYNPIFLILQNK